MEHETCKYCCVHTDEMHDIRPSIEMRILSCDSCINSSYLSNNEPIELLHHLFRSHP